MTAFLRRSCNAWALALALALVWWMPAGAYAEVVPGEGEAASTEAVLEGPTKQKARQAAEEIYSVTFLASDGALLYTQTVARGTALGPPAVPPQRWGHVFLYWYDMSAGEGEPYKFGDPVEADLVLAALFVELPQAERAAEAGTNASRVDSGDSRVADKQAEPPVRRESQAAAPNAPHNGAAADGVANGGADRYGSAGVGTAGDIPPGGWLADITVSTEGEMIRLSGDLTGYEEETLMFTWQYSLDAYTWTDVPDATESSYAFLATPDIAHRVWRLVVMRLGP